MHLLCGSGLELRGGDRALRGKVRLIPHKHDDHVVSPLRAHVGNPLRCRLEGFAIRYVEHDDGDQVGITVSQ